MEEVRLVVLDALRESIAAMDPGRVRHLAERALEQDVAPEVLLKGALMPGIDAFRAEHDRGQRCVQEMWLVQSVHELMRVLAPHLEDAVVDPEGRVVVGTVEGDAHGLGKDLVKLMLESSGFAVEDLGTDVPADAFVQRARDHGADILAMSAMLTTTRGRMRDVVQKLQAQDLRGRVKVMVGGAPITAGFADRIGTDGYAPDATASVGLARDIIADDRPSGVHQN